MAESKDFFRWKEYRIWHDECSMKVGTDSILIGNFLYSEDVPSTILDIGTGSGIISIMAADAYPSANIVAIDIDPQSIEQAKRNFKEAAIDGRANAIEYDFVSFCQQEQYSNAFDLIVSNPPYYEEDTISPNHTRGNARNTSSLSFEELIVGVKKVLAADGSFCVVVPYSSALRFISIAATHCLYVTHRTDVCDSKGKPFKRTLLRFSHHIKPTIHTSQTIR